MRHRSPAERESRTAPATPGRTAPAAPHRYREWRSPELRCSADVTEQLRAPIRLHQVSRPLPEERCGAHEPAPTRRSPGSRGTGEWPAPARSAREIPAARRPRAASPSVVRRRADRSELVTQPMAVVDEARCTEQLLDELRGGETAAPPASSSTRARVLLGSLCGALLLGSAAGLGALTAGSTSEDTTSPEPAHPPRAAAAAATPPEWLELARRKAPIAPPEGTHPELGAVEAFYRHLAANPAAAVELLAPELQGPSRIGPAPARAEALHPVQVRPLGPREVLAEVAVDCADGSRLVLRHKIALTGGPHPAVAGIELRSAQRFPR